MTPRTLAPLALRDPSARSTPLGSVGAPMTSPARLLAICLLCFAGADATAQSGLKAFGENQVGQLNVPVLPAGLYYVEIAAGAAHTLARRNDGSVVAWGYNYFGQNNVPPPPAGLTYTGVAAGNNHSVALLSNGSVVAWGGNLNGEC